MSFSWDHYCKLAGHLKDNPPKGLEDAAYRSAISRAYYSAYGSCWEFATNEGHSKSRNAGDHASLRSYFSRSPNQKRQQIAVTLDRLRTLRNEADYDNPFQTLTLPVQAYFAIKEAEKVLDLLKGNAL